MWALRALIWSAHNKYTLLLIAKIWNETQNVCCFKRHTSPYIGSHGNRKVIAVVPMQIWPSSSRLLPWQSNPQEQLLCHQLEFDHGLLPRSYKSDSRTHTNQTHLVCCYKYHLPSNRSHGKHTHNNCTHTDLTNLVCYHGSQTHNSYCSRSWSLFQVYAALSCGSASETTVHTTIARLGRR